MPARQYFNNLERQSYCAQLLVARKFGEKLSLQISQRYYIATNPKHLPINTLYSVGMGGRFKLNPPNLWMQILLYVTSLFSKADLSRDTQFTNALSIGFDIETGGHVFQLHLSNSKVWPKSLDRTNDWSRWSMGDIFMDSIFEMVFGFDKQKINTNENHHSYEFVPTRIGG